MPSISTKSLDDYQPDPSNPNAGSSRGSSQLEESMRQSGVGRSIVVDKNGRVIAGSHSLETAASIGIQKAVEVETDGDVLVVVKRRDLDLSDDPSHRARRLAYSDNRTTEIGLRWDAGQVFQDMQAGLDLTEMFFEDELVDIFDRAASELDQLAHEGEMVGQGSPTGRTTIEPLFCPCCGTALGVK